MVAFALVTVVMLWIRGRAHKRQELLAATEKNLQAIKARVDAGKLSGADMIGLRVGKIVNQYKVAKHFALAIAEARFMDLGDFAHRAYGQIVPQRDLRLVNLTTDAVCIG